MRRGPVVAAAAAVVLAATVGTVWLLGNGVGGEPAPAALGTAVPTTTGQRPTATRTTEGTTSASTSTSSAPTDTTTETMTTTQTTAPPVLVPDPPSGLTAVAVDPTSIQLGWTDQSTNEAGFEVDDGQVTRTAAADAQQLVWDGLAPGQQGCFRVRAVGEAGASAWEPATDFVCAQTPQSPQQAAQPDLVAQPIELLSGATVCSGDSPVFQASVVNGGSAPSEDFLVRWVADGGQPSDELRGGLPPQAADKYQFTWSGVPAGTHQLAFLADGDGRIPEADETNNGSSVTFEAVDCPG